MAFKKKKFQANEESKVKEKEKKMNKNDDVSIAFEKRKMLKKKGRQIN